MTPIVDAILKDYLDNLRMLSTSLPVDARTELLAGVSEHIDAARDAGEVETPDQAKKLVVRLGDPAELVRASWASNPSAFASSGADEIRGPNTVAAHRQARTVLLLLTIGSVVPLLGWLWGVTIVWTSERWSRRSRLVAALVVPGGPLAALVVSLWLARKTEVTCSSGSSGTTQGLNGTVSTEVNDSAACTHAALTPWLGIVIVVILLSASIIGPLYVCSRGRTERRATVGNWRADRANVVLEA
jgi:hypothetical protein